jgi:toxin ParE1/3/4
VKPILIHVEAQKEIDESFAFYEGRRDGLGHDFVDEVAKATNRIQQFPKLGTKITGTDYRRALVKRFPFLILFRETDVEIRIIAVAHTKRKPGYWMNRSFDDD